MGVFEKKDTDSSPTVSSPELNAVDLSAYSPPAIGAIPPVFPPIVLRTVPSIKSESPVKVCSPGKSRVNIADKYSSTSPESNRLQCDLSIKKGTGNRVQHMDDSELHTPIAKIGGRVPHMDDSELYTPIEKLHAELIPILTSRATRLEQQELAIWSTVERLDELFERPEADDEAQCGSLTLPSES